MKNKIFTFINVGIICCTIALFSTSCIDYDLNQPKYKPQELRPMDYIESMLIIVNPAQENKYQHNNSMIGDNYGRYMSITSEAWSENFSNFNAKDTWIDSPFSDVLTGFYPSWIDLSQMTGEKGIYYAWAKILRVATMHRLTDMYGPIPYSQMGKGLSQTPYDSQQDVYKAMFKDLDDALTEIDNFVIANPTETTIDDEGMDRVYSGNMLQWVKFANSLRLRMAMRVVYADPALAQENAEKAIAHHIGVIKSNTDNAAIRYEPNPINIMWDAYSDTRVCADITSYMNGYTDPRRAEYFQNSTGVGYAQYQGLRVGVDLVRVTQSVAKLYSSPKFDRKDKLMWLNAAEVAFLRAEGALRGWAMGGTAQELYEEGVKLSFDQYQLKDNVYTAYINNSTSRPAAYTDPKGFGEAAQSTITIKWSESANTEEKLERIMTQKWIAMYPLGHEAWGEQRRTGYPRFFKVLENKSAEGALSTNFAARIPFSPAEKITNPANLQKAIELLGGPDQYGTKLWWDKKTNKP